MKDEYTEIELKQILKDCQNNQVLCDCVVSLPRKDLEATIKGHMGRVAVEEELVFFKTPFVANDQRIILSTNTHDTEDSSFRFKNTTKKATH